MSPANPPLKRYSYAPYEGYESRSQRRLHDDLGADKAAAEAILHLRRQVIELQSQLRQMQAELNTLRACHEMRLASTREVFYEATWIELDFQD
jgi:hypothetical protein